VYHSGSEPEPPSLARYGFYSGADRSRAEPELTFPRQSPGTEKSSSGRLDPAETEAYALAVVRFTTQAEREAMAETVRVQVSRVTTVFIWKAASGGWYYRAEHRNRETGEREILAEAVTGWCRSNLRPKNARQKAFGIFPQAEVFVITETVAAESLQRFRDGR
jgi:hypothetical protein